MTDNKNTIEKEITDMMDMSIDQIEEKIEDEKKDFVEDLVTEGMHVAKLFKLIDLGTQMGEYKGAKKENRTLMFIFEVLDEDKEYEKDGVKHKEPKTMAVYKTLGFYEKSNLPSFLRSVYGKKPENITDVIGCYVNIQVLHAQNKDKTKTYANIDNIMNANNMADKPKSKMEDVALILTPSKFKKELYDELNDGDWKTKILETKEYKHCIKELEKENEVPFD